MADLDLAYESQRSLRRIWPKILERIESLDTEEGQRELLRESIEARLGDRWETLFGLLYSLYGKHYDFFYYLESILLTAIDCWLRRPAALHDLDRRRENNPQWYLSEQMVGISLYVDLFAGDLKGVRERIPYLVDLGVSYLHLMPLFASRPGNSDGGYAVSDYREVEARLGTMDDLRELTDALREAGISLVLDFVFNHTSDDHTWAIRAQEGEREFQDYYLTFPDRIMPDAYERNLREIFPSVRRGNFTWHSEMGRWVWTTFNNFQWDLNYRNPEVFRAMAGEMLFLANTGVEILRLDAVAFCWKELGTPCENLPQAHLLIQAFNAICRIAAPGLVFKSEAIVHPDEVVKYIDPEECQISYNPTLMALLWESAATRDIRLLRQSVAHRHQLPEKTVWVNYLRGHDDIGWSFDNGDAWQVGIQPDDHREFLNRFYTGRFPGSFAAGVPFQHNEDTGDMRISGTMASLAGLEQAVSNEDPLLLEMALRRVRLLYGVVCSIGGIPLLFMGEDWGALNDYSYEENPDKAEDSRWVHRVAASLYLTNKGPQGNTAAGMVHRILLDLIRRRKACPALAGPNMALFPINNRHVLAFYRWSDGARLVVIANFSDKEQIIAMHPIRVSGLSHFMRDLFSETVISTRKPLTLEPYQILWLEED